MENETHIPEEIKKEAEKNNNSVILEEARRLEDESKKIMEARRRGEKVKYEPTTDQLVTLYKASRIEHGDKALAGKLGTDMSQFIGQDNASFPGRGGILQAINKMLPEISGNQALKKVYDEAQQKHRKIKETINREINRKLK